MKPIFAIFGQFIWKIEEVGIQYSMHNQFLNTVNNNSISSALMLLILSFNNNISSALMLLFLSSKFLLVQSWYWILLFLLVHWIQQNVHHNNESCIWVGPRAQSCKTCTLQTLQQIPKAPEWSNIGWDHIWLHWRWYLVNWSVLALTSWKFV